MRDCAPAPARQARPFPRDDAVVMPPGWGAQEGTASSQPVPLSAARMREGRANPQGGELVVSAMRVGIVQHRRLADIGQAPDRVSVSGMGERGGRRGRLA